MTAAGTSGWGPLAGSVSRFSDTIRALPDDSLRQASALPGWTRAHVVAHVTQAADSRTGLLLAARAGRVGRQYPSEEARVQAIDAGARQPPVTIHADLFRALRECLTAIREYPGHLWDAPAIWLGTGRRPVRGVVTSLRRELEYHHVDLAAGYRPADWPGDFIDTELPRVTAMMNRRADAPPVTLTSAATLHVGTRPPADITGSLAAMLAWLTGRGDGSDLDPRGTARPVLPPLA